MSAARQFAAARTVLGSIAICVLLVRSAAYLGAELELWMEHLAVIVGLLFGLWVVKSSRAAEPAPAPPLPAEAKPCTDIDEYAQFTVDLWMSGDGDKLDLRQHTVMSLGLSGETGEVMELLKKWLRDGKLDRAHLRKELGDVAYYWARLCRAHGFTPSEVLGENQHKILGRKARGTMHGSGEDR
ncbi:MULTISPECIES: nucleoside triphosphate pyrophosphohydrolase family protein [unclassified Variovorax]|uniref:nucleoside triphosphate pyrophosphohydrolase family protein n=1 Tax=unclassified Variovorax TaxID=663243 RepID=UPI0013196820|nr:MULTISPECIES: nucleoside triphosphate pyrophosphohydrolase family protein [unclassified Variovorax]VTU42567.1 MazG nucleotide pyrophosphohydrolase domain protein [Variovorax sp. PBL-H6]VTU43841.1 MazG nucleotide pyrophosphohydrolase domain protein [Variovorax sp. SRS16]VTU43905.1 MazG nucleotide pyrophosphohydrolase domain protein [Variovorax sp. PBL-E5]